MIKAGPSGRLAQYFLHSKLTLLFVITSLILGVFSVMATPREEEPQIKVPMVDIMVPMPGASPDEIEQRITTPLEKLLWEIPGVEYVYSTASAGVGMVIVRFVVNSDENTALVKIHDQIQGHLDRIPPDARAPLVKLHGIDDVPVLALTLWGKGYDSFKLSRLGEELELQLRAVPEVSSVEVVGAQRREVRVTLDPVRMAAHHVNPLSIAQSLSAFNSNLPAGVLVADSTETRLEVGGFLKDKEDVASVLVGFTNGKPMYLGDVASVEDGPPLPDQYVLFGTGPGAKVDSEGQHPAITLAIAKRPGVNATALNERLLDKIDGLKGKLIPADLHVTVTRNYGKTAGEKSDELIKHIALATISVVLLIAFMLGYRESLVVGIAVPVTLAFTLLVYYLAGYTLNRVTLFALIFSIGILVDDAIVVVENMYRHFAMRDNRSLVRKAVEAVDEVGNPTILATFTVIAAILPMAFVRGMMGPYMRPIPVGASAAMLISLVVAFVVSPWAAYRLLRKKAAAAASAHGGGSEHGEQEMKLVKYYRRFMTRLLASRRLGALFLAGNVLLLAGSVWLVTSKTVKAKMLPFDNKSEFQVVLDMPEGTPLEESVRAAQVMARKLTEMHEVTDYQIYAGTSAPITFNGLVRHYYMRRQSHAADIQVNLLPKDERKRQSHDLAKQARTMLEPLAKELGVALKVVEIPPGPPVIATLVAEVYGPKYDGQIAIARKIRELFEGTGGVVDSDLMAVDPQPQTNLELDPRVIAAAGLTTAEVANAVALAVRGMPVVSAHMPRERELVPVKLQLPRETRFSIEALSSLQLQNRAGTLVPLSEVIRIKRSTIPNEIYHKNLQRVVYVTADVAGSEESPIYAMLKLKHDVAKMTLPDGTVGLPQLYTEMPSVSGYQMKWDGEWQITYEVFRDLGGAFAIVLVVMYVLIVGWFKSYLTPLAIMAPIPLSLVGIIPAHGALGAFFTATSMIGFIALAGVVVRNSILVIDFAEMRMEQGVPVREALVDGGAVRFRPMLLTALAVVVGSSVMLTDPIFQGMAIALIAGEVASTLLSWGAIPVLYTFFAGNRSPATAPVDENAPHEGAVPV